MWDVSGVLGAAVLRGPACKTGVWDLDYHLSPNLTFFYRTLVSLVSSRGAALGTDGTAVKPAWFSQPCALGSGTCSRCPVAIGFAAWMPEMPPAFDTSAICRS